MEDRRLLTVSRQLVKSIGYGTTSVIPEPNIYFYSDAPKPDKAIETLTSVINMGYNLFDTARLYGNEASENHIERLLCNAIKKSGVRREDLFISTKGGLYFDGKDFKLALTPAEIRADLNNSLSRLGTHYVDVYFLHRIDPTHPGLEASILELAKLRDEGKTRFIGISDVDGKTIQQVNEILKRHNKKGLDFIQNEYSLMYRDSEEKDNGVFKVCKEENIIFMAYCPTGRGLLANPDSKTFEQLNDSDVRKAMLSDRYHGWSLRENVKKTEHLKSMATQKSCSTSQLALAWTIKQGERKGVIVIPIPGTKNLDHAQENLGANNLLCRFSDNECKALNTSYPKGTFIGARWPTQPTEKKSDEFTVLTDFYTPPDSPRSDSNMPSPQTSLGGESPVKDKAKKQRLDDYTTKDTVARLQ